MLKYALLALLLISAPAQATEVDDAAHKAYEALPSEWLSCTADADCDFFDYACDDLLGANKTNLEKAQAAVSDAAMAAVDGVLPCYRKMIDPRESFQPACVQKKCAVVPLSVSTSDMLSCMDDSECSIAYHGCDGAAPVRADKARYVESYYRHQEEKSGVTIQCIKGPDPHRALCMQNECIAVNVTK